MYPNTAIAAPARPAGLDRGWAVVLVRGTALYGLVASGIGLFNESILAERGYGPAVFRILAALIASIGLVAIRVPLPSPESR